MDDRLDPQEGSSEHRRGLENMLATSKTKAPEQTFEEVKYLRQLAEAQTRVRVRLSDNEEVDGTVEFYDANFIRLTRADGPNLFLFKHDIKYLYELS
jgi:sRNA-binding regulator protein Hfq